MGSQDWISIAAVVTAFGGLLGVIFMRRKHKADAAEGNSKAALNLSQASSIVVEDFRKLIEAMKGRQDQMQEEIDSLRVQVQEIPRLRARISELESELDHAKGRTG